MATKNKIEDLRNHLFLQLEKLADEDLKGDALKEEINRSEAISGLADQIIQSAKVEVRFMEITNGDGTGFIPQKRLE
jgi:hypothetical protein